MRVSFHPAADEEFVSALTYYHGKDLRIAAALYEAVFRGVAEIAADPDLAPEVEPGTRRLLISPFRYRRFSHGLIYVVREPEIRVVAVMDMRRKPGYWRLRLR